MAEYRVLYWQEIPTQVKATDDHGEVNLELDPKFMLLVDKLAIALLVAHILSCHNVLPLSVPQRNGA